jgi:hypothetical protein
MVVAYLCFQEFLFFLCSLVGFICLEELLFHSVSHLLGEGVLTDLFGASIMAGKEFGISL